MDPMKLSSSGLISSTIIAFSENSFFEIKYALTILEVFREIHMTLNISKHFSLK